jgi:hypothetical protein
MTFPIALRRYESEAEKGESVEVAALCLVAVGGIAFFRRYNFPYFGIRSFSKDGGFSVPEDIVKYEVTE